MIKVFPDVYKRQHVRREAEQVGNALARKRKAPDPGIVRHGAVEAVRGVFPLLLRQGCTAAGVNGQAGVLGSGNIGFGVVLGRTALKPGPGFQSVDQRRTDRIPVSYTHLSRPQRPGEGVLRLQKLP